MADDQQRQSAHVCQQLLLLSDEELIATCQNEPSSNEYGFRTKGVVYPSMATPIAFIKYSSDHDSMEAEARNQRFAFEALRKMPRAATAGIYIPEIYRVIKKSNRVYIVMEYIHGDTLEQLWDKEHAKECLNQVVKAVRLFLSIPIPDTFAPGPVGGGILKHPLFKDAEAPILYPSIAFLQKHIENVANLAPNNNFRIDFSKEKLCFCFSDLFGGNFIFNTNTGRLYVVDYEHASIVPTSLMTYVLNQQQPVCVAIKDSFDLPTENLEALKAAGYYFMISVRKAGLPVVL